MKKLQFLPIVLCIFSFHLMSQEELKLIDDLGEAGDNFGLSVAISGDYAVVGAPYHDYILTEEIQKTDNGRVVFYKKNNDHWEENPSTPHSSYYYHDSVYYGYDVDIDGTDAIVTSPWMRSSGHTRGGNAFIYELIDDTWVANHRLDVDDPSEDARFGISAAICGDYAIVGAFFDDLAGDRSGSAYIFKKEEDTWTQYQKLVPDDGEAGDWFGVEVSISNTMALVGSRYNDNDGGTNAGAVYIYRLNEETWAFAQKLYPQFPGSDNDGFEKNAINEKYLAFAAINNDSIAENGGVTYIMSYGDEPSFNEIIYSEDIAENDHFGHSLALYDDNLVVGAPSHNDKGAVYLYDLPELNEEVKITASDGADDDKFGYCVDMFGDYIIVGAYQNDENGDNAGAVYIYNLSDDTVTTASNALYENSLNAIIYPNPFNMVTNITYTLPESCHVLAEIFDITGNKVKTLVNNMQTAGEKTIEWKGTDDANKKLPSGYYLCKVQASEKTMCFKIIKNN